MLLHFFWGAKMQPSENPLIERLKLRRYRKGSPKKILDDILKALRHTGLYGRQSWDLLVELLADKLRPMELEKYKISLLPETKHRDLADKYSDLLEHFIVLSREKPWDYLGEIFIEERLDNKRLGQNLTPRNVCDMMTKMVYAGEKFEKPVAQLDPCVGTGRFLLSATLMYPKAPLRLFGIEIDLSLYRSCIVNLALYANHPWAVLCADTLRCDPKLTGPGSPIWLLAGNRWDPPWKLIEKCYWKPPPITSKKFSLSHWTRDKQK